MKRYFAFWFHWYYPSGGMKDFAGDFDTIEEAKTACHQKSLAWADGDEDDLWEYQAAHIFDSHQKKIIASKNEKEDWESHD